TYLRLSGDLAGLPSDALAKASEGTVVVDLERIRALDPTGVSQWRNYLQAVPAQTSLQLHACPPGFLEQAVTPEDFSRLKVRTFQLPYGCVSCNATTVALID